MLEETGYDIEDLVQEEHFIELTLDGKRNKLYIVAGLDPNSAQFAPKCKGVSVQGVACGCCWTHTAAALQCPHVALHQTLTLARLTHQQKLGQCLTSNFAVLVCPAGDWGLCMAQGC